MFDPNFKVGDVFKSATIGTEIELVAKGLKAGFAKSPRGNIVGLRSNGQKLGQEETDQVQGRYNYQNLIMKENQKQLDYFKDLTEGKIGLASALLNPRTKQVTGRNIFVYAITKEGERIPVAVKTQRSKQGESGKLSTTYQWHKDTQKCFKGKS